MRALIAIQRQNTGRLPYADTGSHTVLCLAYAGAVAGDRRSLDTSSPGETIPTQGRGRP